MWDSRLLWPSVVIVHLLSLCDARFNLVFVTFLCQLFTCHLCDTSFLGLSDLSVFTLSVLCLIQGVLMFVLVTHYHTISKIHKSALMLQTKHVLSVIWRL